MVVYVGIIALLNLGLGYVLAVKMGAGSARAALASGDGSDYADSSDSEE
jgi:hypothetical protein